jgi:hypothetical protein
VALCVIDARDKTRDATDKELIFVNFLLAFPSI